MFVPTPPNCSALVALIVGAVIVPENTGLIWLHIWYLLKQSEDNSVMLIIYYLLTYLEMN